MSVDVGLLQAADIDGLVFRPFVNADDYQAIADLIAVSHLADGDEYVPDAASLQIDWETTPGFNAPRDIILAEVRGRLIAYGGVDRQVRDGVAVYVTSGTVHPDFRRRGLGRTIVRRNETRLREMAETHRDRGGRTYAAWVGDREGGARELLLAEGYGPVRYSFAMIRSDLDDLPQWQLPEGLELRGLRPEDHRAVFDADNEAFRDHWGHHEATELDFVGFFKFDSFEPGLCRVAWDGDQVAGSVLTFVWKLENEKLGVRRGWFERVSVRRPWRRRGLARAMLVSAMAGLRDAGLEQAMLGVDAENPNGALPLYTSLGFVIKDSGTSLRKAW